MAIDPVAEFAQKEEFDRAKAVKHQAMNDLIRSSETHFLVLEHNDKKIRIRPAIPGSVRSKVIGMASKYKGIDLEALKRGEGDLGIIPELQADSEEQLYNVLAALCIDAPYNEPENWKYYDEITGEAERIYLKAEAMIKEAHESAISFRPVAGGTSDH